MTRKITAVLCLLGALLAANAEAVLIDGRDWLQVTATRNFSATQFDAIFDRSTGQCDVAGCMLGGLLDVTGYTWASNADVDAMIQSFGLAGLTTLTANDVVIHPADSLDPIFALLDATVVNLNDQALRGWTRDQSALIDRNDVVSLFRFVGAADANSDVTTLQVNLFAGTTGAAVGGWLYRNADTNGNDNGSGSNNGIPEPTSLALMGLALLGVGRRWKPAH